MHVQPRFPTIVDSKTDRRTFLKSFVAGVSALLATPALSEELTLAQVPPENLEDVLEPVRRTHSVLALAGAVVRGGELIALGVVGLRQVGGTERVQSNDRFHIGSNTKSMTATLIALVVEQGRLSWEMTIADAFPDMLTSIHPGFQRVTLLHLLSHRAGLPEDSRPDPATWPQIRALTGPLPQQRRTFIELILGRPPATEPGSRFAYSNFGYTIAGAIVEQATRQAWEDSMRQMLFQPLGMASAGFGSPGLAQPWGHRPNGCQPITPGPDADNPAVLGPAGRVHCSMSDWARYASLHLRGARGESGLLLKPETFQQLHRDGFGQEYALGWGIAQRPWTRGVALAHAGSNTMWFAVIWIAPARNAGLLAATNCGSDEASRASEAAIGAMIGRFLS